MRLNSFLKPFFRALAFLSPLFILGACFVSAQEAAPQARSGARRPAAAASAELYLAGNSRGLYSIRAGTFGSSLLWQGGAVKKIIKADDFASEGQEGLGEQAAAADSKAGAGGWYFLTEKGVIFSKDLVHFEERNSGLPFRTIKTYKGGKAAFEQQLHELSDLAVLQGNPNVLVTATTKSVYLSMDGGLSWRSLGRSATTEGIKTAAPAMLPDSAGATRLVVFMSHPVYGVSYIYPEVDGARWIDINDGLEKMPTMTSPDEVASFAVSKSGEVYASQSFIPAIYKLDWAEKRFEQIFRSKDDVGSFDGLSALGEGEEMRFFFTGLNSLKTFSKADGLDDINAWSKALSSLRDGIECLYVPAGEAKAAKGSGGEGISFSKMWLLSPTSPSSEYAKRASGKKGIYVPVWQVTDDAGLDAHLETIKSNNLNMLVIDMKDDYGILRYDAKDPLVLEKGQTGRGIQVESFVEKAKRLGIYLVARIVVFKDRELSRHGGGKYAVWDKRENAAWRGYRLVEETSTDENGEAVTQTVRSYYDEYWVDPYCEEVWEYNVAVAKELIARGFDEIQFDYIRFPTDGRNLGDASYRWQSGGMDMESALVSFLAYARQEIRAPISIDIYGANGWYRTGSRTGQHIELLSKYVDVICPMFYPSHFENSFLAQAPAVERPYRIYYYGSWRNTIIAGNNSIVRPWAQAFYLNVAYDRQYYNEDYVQRQIFGVRDSINLGYTYWNNSGRYTDIRPD